MNDNPRKELHKRTNSAIMKKLLGKKNKTIYDAIKENDLTTFQEIIKKAIKHKLLKELLFLPDSDDNTPLLLAMKLEQEKMVDELLKLFKENKDIDINTTDVHGFTLLHFAVEAVSDKMLVKLLGDEELNIDVNIRNNDQNTAFHYFCEKYSSPNVSEPFELMMKRKANIEALNSNGETPLHKAIFNKTVRLLMVELLLKKGANVNAISKMSYSPLLYAIRLKREDLVTLLLKNGADVNIATKNGETPLKLARDFNLKSIEKRLQDVLEIQQWLTSLGMAEYTSCFVKEELYVELLGELTEPVLEKIGVASAGPRLKILQSCSQFRKQRERKTDPPMVSLRVIDDPEKKNNISISEIQNLLQDNSLIIQLEHLEFTKKIGSGGNAKVFKGLYKEEIPVAIKVLKEMPEKNELEQFKKELEIVSKTKSPDIVKFIGCVLQPKLCLVMEFCSRGSLYQLMKDERIDFGWDKVLKFAFQMTRGIDHLHASNIVHRDVKSLNLLVTEEWDIRVCDFGLSRFLTEQNLKTLRELRGTSSYCAPEIVSGGNFTQKGDVYGIAIVMWELVNRCIKGVYEAPYQGKDLTMEIQILGSVQKGNRPNIQENWPPTLAQLIKKSWSQEPELRPTCKEILKALKEDVEQEFKANQQAWNELRTIKEVSDDMIIDLNHDENLNTASN